MSQKIYFVSLISRDNRPIHVQQIAESIDSNQLLKYHFLSNMALDVFASALYDTPKNTVQLLFMKDQINVYGYETNTSLKIIVGTNYEMKADTTLFTRIHKVYLNLIINPFQTEELKINEKSFSDRINKIVESI